jgi:hypothetical protein
MANRERKSMKRRQVWIVVLVLVTVVTILIVIDNLDKSWRDLAYIVLYLVGLFAGLTLVVVRLWQRAIAGAALLTLPSCQKRRSLFLLVCGVVLSCVGIYLLTTLPDGLEEKLAQIGGSGYCLMVPVMAVVFVLMPPRFTEYGFFTPSGFIVWRDVASFRWGENGSSIMLLPKRNLPFYIPRPWPVAIGQKDEVEKLLDRFAVMEEAMRSRTPEI